MSLKDNLYTIADQLCNWDGQVGKLQYLDGFLNITGEMARRGNNDDVLNALIDCSRAINDVINNNTTDPDDSVNNAISAITNAISSL